MKAHWLLKKINRLYRLFKHFQSLSKDNLKRLSVFSRQKFGENLLRISLFSSNYLYVSIVLFFFVFFVLSVNWCQHWFEFFPNPPVNILCMVENVLVHHDKRLMQHFVSCHVTSQVRPQKASSYSYSKSWTPSHLMLLKTWALSIW